MFVILFFSLIFSKKYSIILMRKGIIKMINAYKDFWKNYFNFSGKTSVSGFWWTFLCNIIIGFIIGLVAGILKLNIISTIWGLAIFIPELSILCRRLNDGNHSLLNILWLFLPLIGWIILLIKLCK